MVHAHTFRKFSGTTFNDLQHVKLTHKPCSCMSTQKRLKK